MTNMAVELALRAQGIAFVRAKVGDRYVLEELEKAKPSSAKGRYFKKVSLSSTMGPGVKLDPQRMLVVEEV